VSIYIPSFSEKRIVAQSRGADSCDPGKWRGLVLGLPCDEPGGLTAFDVSGYHRDGTLTNMDTATDHVVTRMGRALDFDGSNDYVTATVPNGIAIANPFTVCLWAKRTDGATTLKGLFNIQAADADSDQILIVYYGGTNTNGLQASRAANPAQASKPAITITQGIWNHFAFTQTGGTIRPTIYVNGILNDTSYISSLSRHHPNALTLGTGLNSLYFAQHQQTNVLVHNRVLRPSEIRDLYVRPWAMYTLRRRVQVRGAEVGTTIRWPWQQRRHRRMAGVS